MMLEVSDVVTRANVLVCQGVCLPLAVVFMILTAVVEHVYSIFQYIMTLSDV